MRTKSEKNKYILQTCKRQVTILPPHPTQLKLLWKKSVCVCAIFTLLIRISTCSCTQPRIIGSINRIGAGWVNAIQTIKFRNGKFNAIVLSIFCRLHIQIKWWPTYFYLPEYDVMKNILTLRNELEFENKTKLCVTTPAAPMYRWTTKV